MDTSPHHLAGSPLLDVYPIRIMLGLVSSLGFIIILVNLPLRPSVSQVGWSRHTITEQIVFEEVITKPSEDPPSNGTERTPPATDFQAFQSTERPGSTSPESSGTTATQRDSGRIEQYENIRSLSQLNVSDETPQIVGGAGSLYLHINYPEKALKQGIEGQLKLEFTVKTDGTVAHIEVVKSLHPLCDSAAVEGVRSVTFVPAKHNGTPIPIRLRLPVRFQLRTLSSSLPMDQMNP